VIGIAILMSGVISLTLTPLLCSRFLKEHAGEMHGPIFQWSERIFEAVRGFYDRTLKVALRHGRIVLLVALATMVGTAWLFMTLPKGFIPNEDTGQIFAFTEAAQGTSFVQMAKLQQQASALVLGNPYVEGYMSSIGVGGSTNTGNSGRIYMNLKPRKERPSADAMIAELRPKLAAIPGLKVFPQIVPSIRIGGNLTKSLYQYTLFGPDLNELYSVAPKVEAKMRVIPGLVDVTSDLQITNPQVMVEIDRDKASALGVSANQIESALANSYGAQQVSTIYTATNQYQVIVEALPKYQESAVDLHSLYIRSTSGKLIPLSAVTKITRNVGPLTVQHLGQLPAVTLSFNVSDGTSLGDAIPKIEAAVKRATFPRRSAPASKARRRRSNPRCKASACS